MGVLETKILEIGRELVEEIAPQNFAHFGVAVYLETDGTGS